MILNNCKDNATLVLDWNVQWWNSNNQIWVNPVQGCFDETRPSIPDLIKKIYILVMISTNWNHLAYAKLGTQFLIDRYNSKMMYKTEKFSD